MISELAAPYGERWGRHWLDVARYADTAGDGADYPVREAGQYRDWVINSFNVDQPYDEFLREQITGDILVKTGPPQEFASRVTATGFLAIGKRYGYSPAPDFQYLDFADAIDSVGRSMLGLSLGCARCHDHKYDPVTASDYYALYDILQSSTWAFPGGEEQKRPVHFPPLVPPEEATRLDQIKSAKLAALDTEIATLKSERVAQESKSRTEAGTDSLADSAFKSADCPARRLAEHGVRFLELIDVGSSNNWDSHANMGDHERLAKDMAPPVENRRKPKQFGNG